LQILEVHLQDKPLRENVELLPIAQKTDGLTGSDLRALIERAAYFALGEIIEGTMSEAYINQIHLERALNEVLKERKAYQLPRRVSL